MRQTFLCDSAPQPEEGQAASSLTLHTLDWLSILDIRSFSKLTLEQKWLSYSMFPSPALSQNFILDFFGAFKEKKENPEWETLSRNVEIKPIRKVCCSNYNHLWLILLRTKGKMCFTVNDTASALYSAPSSVFPACLFNHAWLQQGDATVSISLPYLRLKDRPVWLRTCRQPSPLGIRIAVRLFPLWPCPGICSTWTP